LDNPTNTRLALHPNQKTHTRKIALLSLLFAVCTALQVVPRPPGLEFTSLVTFTTGVVFGSVFGASLGFFVMFVNAFLSPWGFASLNMIFQMLGMSIIGTVGGFYKIDQRGNTRFYIETAILGAFLTFIYQIILNLGYAIYVALFLSKISFLEALVLVQVTGVVFTVTYIVTNTIIFGVGAVPLVNAMRKILWGKLNVS
jgi:hypothetical protein